MPILETLIIAIGLSMDAFSLALSYGMLNIDKKKIIEISLIVGLFHFFMPFLGSIIGNYIVELIIIDEDKLMGIIFLFITIELFTSLLKKEEIKPLRTTLEIIIFAFTVSIDSFTTGIGINTIKLPNFVIALIFMIISGIFTLIGLEFGRNIKEKIGRKANFIGIIILFVLSIKYLLS